MPYLEGVKKQKRRATFGDSPDHQGASTQHSIPVYVSGLIPIFEFDVKDSVKREQSRSESVAFTTAREVFLPSAPHSLLGEGAF